ncbi:hypothetical protein ACFLRY_02060 [Bacteroidota bacterium]
MKYKILFLLSIISIIALFSCEKDYENAINLPTSIQVGYEKDEAAEIMTLAAIAYVAEGLSTQAITDSIRYYLADSSLASAGEWQLVWGPGIDNTNSNLVYIAKSKTQKTDTYAMVVRGTSIYSITDILQDIQVFTLVPFKYGLPGDSIANGSMIGLDKLIQTTDPSTGKTLKEYLAGTTGNLKGKMYITGHSQGGALAPLLTYWFITQSGVGLNFDIETYAFAGSSVCNKTFKTNFFNSLPPSAQFHMVANELDAIPYFWAMYDSLAANSIPTHVPALYKNMLKTISEILDTNKIKYVQLAKQISIGSFTPKDTIGSIHPSDTLSWYNYWMKVEHIHNNYLRLLNAQTVN